MDENLWLSFKLFLSDNSVPQEYEKDYNKPRLLGNSFVIILQSPSDIQSRYFATWTEIIPLIFFTVELHDNSSSMITFCLFLKNTTVHLVDKCS